MRERVIKLGSRCFQRGVSSPVLLVFILILPQLVLSRGLSAESISPGPTIKLSNPGAKLSKPGAKLTTQAAVLSQSPSPTTTTISSFTVTDELNPAPFWKSKSNVYQTLVEERRIVCSARTDKAENGPHKDKYELNVVTAGLVNVPIESTWKIIKKFEDLKRADDRFQEVTYDARQQRLYLHLVAYGYHAHMTLQLLFGEGTKAREIHFETIEGSFKGMTGVIRLEDYQRQKTEMAMTTDYASEKIPLPRILLGVGIEVVGSRVAASLRRFIENEFQRGQQ